MPIAEYPASLPLAQWSGYGYQRNHGVLRTEAAGFTLNRRKRKNAPTPMPLTFKYTDAQFTAFKDWLETDVADGGAQFKYLLETPSGIYEHTMKMVGDYQWQALAPDLWQVSMRVEVYDLRREPDVFPGLIINAIPEQPDPLIINGNVVFNTTAGVAFLSITGDILERQPIPEIPDLEFIDGVASINGDHAVSFINVDGDILEIQTIPEAPALLMIEV